MQTHLQLDLNAIEHNLKNLKQNALHLTQAHAREITDRTVGLVSTVTGRINKTLIHLNGWAQKRLEHFREEEEKQKELEQQISRMEDEGNIPPTAEELQMLRPGAIHSICSIKVGSA